MALRNAGDAHLLELAIQVLEESADASPWATIAETLAEALDAAALTVTDIRQGGATPVAWAPSRMPGKLVHDLSKESVRAKNPLIAHYSGCSDSTPRTADEVTGRVRWRDSAARSVARHYFDADNVLAVPWARSDGVLRSLVVYRPVPFRAGHREFARRAQPLLSAVDAHDRVMSRIRSRHGQAVVHRSREVNLTARELTVLALLAEALPAKAIARRLGVSPRTVHKHTQNLYKKLGTRDRVEAILQAQAMGLLGEPA